MMSPSPWVMTNLANIYPNTSAQDAVGAPMFVYTAPSRQGVACSVQYVETGVDEATFGRIVVVNVYYVFFGYDPKLKPRDKVVWTDPSPNRTLFVQVNPPSEAGRDSAFVVRCIEQI